MKNTLLIIGLTVLLPNISFAAWTPSTQIDWLRAYPGNNHTHHLKLANRSVDDGCTGTKNTGIYVIQDEGGRVYSTALAAIMANRDVSFQISGCVGSYAKIVEISVPRQ